jgi:hypothetical protein
VLHAYGAGRAGYANGVIARGQQIARAAGPVSAAAMATTTGYAAVFAALAVFLVAASGLTWPRNRLGAAGTAGTTGTTGTAGTAGTPGPRK